MKRARRFAGHQWWQIVVFAGVVALWAPHVANSNETEDVKETYQQLVGAINQGDLNSLDTFWHDLVVISGNYLPHPVQGKINWVEALHGMLGNVEKVGLHPRDTRLKLSGNVATLEVKYAYEYRIKGSPRPVRALGEMTLSFLKTDGRWLVVSGVFYHL
jgi:ketosteroid isomerase-like protein